MLELRNVSFSYGKEDVLKNINMKINDGEFISLTGPNGSGKSTLALLLLGILKAQTGEIIIDGVKSSDAEKFEEKRRSIGVVFQNPDNQFITTSVERELAFGLENMGIKREGIIERVEEALERFSLKNLRYRSPHTLSGGEKQKVAIASILILNPRYIILDEPSSFLDPSSREVIQDVIQQLRGDITVVFISQFPEEILMGEKIYFLMKGFLEGPFRDEEVLRKRIFKAPYLCFLDALNDRGIYQKANVPEPESLCDAIEAYKKISHRKAQKNNIR